MGKMTQFTEQKITAIYCRISKEDDHCDLSNSICNQQHYLTTYAEKHGLTNLRVYTDDGYTGLNFNRPGIQALLADAEAGQIGTVIVKDRSRFGRDYLTVGQYTELRFPDMGIRFISVDEQTDSNTDEQDAFYQLHNLFNERYSVDMSMKIRASLYAKAVRGEHMGHIPYGYQTDPGNSRKWIVDPEAAMIIQDIFKMYITGMSMSAIAKHLTASGVDTPAVYKARKGKERSCQAKAPEKQMGKVRWGVDTVASILDQYQYCGHTVSNRGQTISCKMRRYVVHLQEQWIVTRDTHEAIIAEETWKQAQRFRIAGSRPAKLHPDHGPLRGILFCSECDRPMNFARCAPQRPGFFQCKGHEVRGTCCNHRIPRLDAEQIVYRYITKMTSAVDKQMLTGELQKRTRIKKKASALQTQIKKEKLMIAEIDRNIRKHYEEMVAGILSVSQLTEILVLLETKQAEIHERENALQNKLDEIMERFGSPQWAEALYDQMCQTERLKREVVSALIDKIIVGKRVTKNGAVTQNVRIIFNMMNTN